jgi:hypothetical protein
LILALLISSACSEEEMDPEIIESEYELDGKVYSIETNLFWVRSDRAGEEDQLRLIQETSGEGEEDMIVLIPVQGDGRLEGSYIYSKTGDIRTYDIVYVKNIENKNSFEWITNGDVGSPLQIIRAGSVNGKPRYTVLIDDFDLNYGFYDFLGDAWVSLGIKKFRFQYQGTIDDSQ